MRHLTLLLILFIFVQTTTFAQSQKTFVKSLSIDASDVVINLEGKAVTSEWNEAFIRVTTTVEVTNFSEEMLKRLVAVGRYNIETEVVDGKMIISMPKLSTKVTIKGELLIEVVSYEVFVPKGTNVTVVSQML